MTVGLSAALLFMIAMEKRETSGHHRAVGNLRARNAEVHYFMADGFPPANNWYSHLLRGIRDYPYHVILRKVAVDDEILANLAKLDALIALELTDCNVSDDDLKILRSLNLHSFELAGNPITDLGLSELGGMVRLRLLDLRHTDVTKAGINRLKVVLPELEVESTTTKSKPANS